MQSRTVGNDRDAVWWQACAKHGVFLAGMTDTNDVLHIGERKLENLVHQDGAQLRKSKKGVVGKHYLRWYGIVW